MAQKTFVFPNFFQHFENLTSNKSVGTGPFERFTHSRQDEEHADFSFGASDAERAERCWIPRAKNPVGFYALK